MTNTSDLPIIEVESIEELEDGSASIVFSMDNETLKLFAGIGIKKVLMDSIQELPSDMSDVDNNVGC